MPTHATREHPTSEQLDLMADEPLWTYILGEIDFLANDTQRRVPLALASAIEEAGHRAAVCRDRLAQVRKVIAKLLAAIGIE